MPEVASLVLLSQILDCSTDSILNPFEFKINYIIPSGLYAVCTFEAENCEVLTNEALYKAANYMINIWLSDKNEKYTFKQNMTIEVYSKDSYKKDIPKMSYYFPINIKHALSQV